ncbi:hypothetical protein [Ruminococcus sp.]|uniref:hypothetical protein n=1 Tax=Ruminococcus sp. TaxID=41978 RepID=UPI0025DB1FEE|nr:hypothetical protein [Ruminococcus sp.]MBQ6252461.1 hypothetical protein [Ruminococcus sp.]
MSIKSFFSFPLELFGSLKNSLPTSKQNIKSKKCSERSYDEIKKQHLRNLRKMSSIEMAALRANVDVDDLREISYVAGGHRWEYEYGFDDWEYYDLIDDYLNDRIR